MHPSLRFQYLRFYCSFVKTDPAHTPVPTVPKVGLISLGCAKNLVDAEIMLGSLLKAGHEIVNDAADAEVVIVNTCSFIDAAQEESIDTILESAELREKTRPDQGLIVAGCLPQRFREELSKLLPEVDAFMGIDQVSDVSRIVREAMQHRAQREASPAGRKSKRGRQEVAKALAPGEAGRPASGAEADESLRGTEQFGKTRRQITVPATPPPAIFDVALRPDYIPDYATPRFRLTPAHFAYVKIAEGCNHPCSFCIIPRMRGGHRSRALADLVQEARQLLADGVKELNLISQDSTYYGLDLRPDRQGSIASPEKFTKAAHALPPETPTLCALLRALNELEGDFWIRLLYTHPAHWTDELIQTIAECGKVARYVDMPLQHIHPVMLERMRRETTRDYIESLIDRIRAGIPGIALRTTFIVGFPGETGACFDELLDFIERRKFERLGVFTYSKEEGTRAGGMAGQLPEKLKQERRNRAMAAQLGVSRKIAASWVGRELTVLVEKAASTRELKGAQVQSWEHGLIRGAASAGKALAGAYMSARGEADAPDIDGRVFVRGSLPAGGFARVKVVGHTDYDLVATPV